MKDMLKNWGCTIVTRSAASRSKIDIVGVDEKVFYVMLVQCKEKRQDVDLPIFPEGSSVVSYLAYPDSKGKIVWERLREKRKKK